jgi:PAS domain S-box-containing protein
MEERWLAVGSVAGERGWQILRADPSASHVLGGLAKECAGDPAGFFERVRLGPAGGCTLRRFLEAARPFRSEGEISLAEARAVRVRVRGWPLADPRHAMAPDWVLSFECSAEAPASLTRAGAAETVLLETIRGRALVVADANGRVTNWNRLAAELFGYQPHEIAGCPCSLLFPEDEARQRQQRLFEGLNRAGWFVEEGWCRRKDGTLFWGEITCTALTGAGVDHGFAKIVRDRGLDRAAREELERMSDRLREVEPMRQLGELTRGVVHDFNNLLGAIACHRSALEDGVGTDLEIREILNEIGELVTVGARMAKDLSDWEERRTSEPCAVVDLGILASEMVRLLKVQMPAGSELELHAPTRHLLVEGRSVQLRRLIFNLVKNAFSALPPEGGQIVVEVDRRSFDGRREGASLVVRDNGCGMRPELVEWMRYPLPDALPPEVGLGVGLKIVRAIAREHGARIAIGSEPGRGTYFEVVFPAKAIDSVSAPSADERTPASHP